MNTHTEDLATLNLPSSQALYTSLLSKADQILNNHPFKKLESQDQILELLPHFLGISVAFPYVQSGSQLNVITEAITQNHDIAEEYEITSAVGNFLSWDETGGAFVVEKFGKAELYKILDTRKWFHSNLLRQDIDKIIGTKIVPNFSEPTKSYIISVIQGFSNPNHVIRCANMVAFELHAKTIIEELWKGICKYFDCNRDDLIYFKIHVGDDDPAETYHVKMVCEMINRIVPKEYEELFLNTTMETLSDHLNWSSLISKSVI